MPPDGEITWLWKDADLGVTGTNKVGAESIFILQVHPTNVSFNSAVFRENIPEQTIIWPNGSATVYPSKTSVVWGVQVNTGNKTWDTVGSGMASVMKLHNGSGFVDFSWDRLVSEENLNEENEWVDWLSGGTHPREYRGADRKARVIRNVSNTAEGGWMGPWD